MKKGFSTVLALLVMCSMVLTACGGPDPTATPPPATATATGGGVVTTATSAPVAPTTAPTTAPVPTTGGGSTGGEAGVLRFNIGSEPENLDPQAMSFVGEIGVGELVFEGLMELDKDLNPVPAAAEGVTVSADGLKYTVKVRQGLKYSDGQPLNARNFEYAWKRLFDPRVPNKQYTYVAYDIAGAEELDAVKADDVAGIEAGMANLGVKATDDYTIEFTLKQQAAYFPYILTLWTGWPSRQDLVDKGGEQWTIDPKGAFYVGNGPFIITEYKGDQGINFKANPNYRKGAPKIKELRAVAINDSAVAFQSYKKGELDFLNIAPEDFALAQNDPELSDELSRIAGSCNFYIGFNTQKPPFDNIKVRQAFAQAFDRDDYVTNVEKGLGQVALSFIPPDRPGHAPDLQLYKFDVAKAKALLAEAGYAEGAGLPPIKLTYSASPRRKTRMEWIQNQLRQNLGIQAELDPVEASAYTGLVKDPATTPQVFFLGWCQDYPDPQNWLTLVFHSSSTVTHVGWKNDEFDQKARQADAEQDQAKRLQLYREAQEILVREAPVVFLFWDENPWLVKPYVKGMKENIIPQDRVVPGFANLVNIEVTP